MAKFDVRCIGQCMRQPFRVAASAVRGYCGEPMIVAPTLTTGVSDVNTIVVLSDDKPVIGTDEFVGILAKDMVVSGVTPTAQRVVVDVPFPMITRMEAQVTTASTADTESEAIGLLFDIYVFDRIADATGGTYTWKPAGVDTGGFQARWYNTANSKLQCVADPRAITRVDITD